MSKKKKLEVIRETWGDCHRCSLRATHPSPEIVFGAGVPEADFLIVTEAPSAEDVLEGAILTGEEGEVFFTVVRAAGIDPQRVYRTALVGCRSYAVIPATELEEERVVDTSPPKEAVATCRARLDQIIYAVDPRIILTLGPLAYSTLVRPKDRGSDDNTLAKAQGKLFYTHIQGRVRTLRYPVLPLLSPAQMLSNPSGADHGPIAVTTKALNRAGRYVSRLRRIT
jgi:uracil-DNA glycosylase family 4